METNGCTAALDLQVYTEKKSTFLRAKVPVSDIAMLRDAFWNFVLTQEQAVTSQKADYAYLAYVEVISSVIFFPLGMSY